MSVPRKRRSVLPRTCAYPVTAHGRLFLPQTGAINYLVNLTDEATHPAMLGLFSELLTALFAARMGFICAPKNCSYARIIDSSGDNYTDFFTL